SPLEGALRIGTRVVAVSGRKRVFQRFRRGRQSKAAAKRQPKNDQTSGPPCALRTVRAVCRQPTQEENPLLLTLILDGRRHHIPPATPARAFPEPVIDSQVPE